MENVNEYGLPPSEQHRRMPTNAELGFPEYKVRKVPKKKKVVYVKPQSLKQLCVDYKIWHYSRYKHMEASDGVDFKYSDSNANELTKSIVAFLTMRGHFAARINTQGTYSVALKRFIYSGSTKGMADVNAVVHGRSISIEVKFSKDSQRKEQKVFRIRLLRPVGFTFLQRPMMGFWSKLKNTYNYF